MSDRVSMLEERVAALEDEVRKLRGTPRALEDNPLANHPLICKRPPREVLERLEAEVLRDLGLEDVEVMDPEALRQMMIDRGLDPNTTQFSRGIIEMREE